jgi:Ser/Thr protein kinase RdoA (MazF antagonist)
MEIGSCPDPETMNWVSSIVGPFEIVSQFAHGHGYSQLWRIWSGGRYLWLKLHAYPGKWAGEVYALSNWGSNAVPSPSVLAVRSDPPGLLMTEVPGIMATDIALEGEEERRLWREAGTYLAELHKRQNEWFGAALLDGSPQGLPNYDAAKFVRASLESRIRIGTEQGLWSEEERSFIVKATESWSSSLDGETPVAIHRDFGPRNWLTGPDGNLTAVIDWEHARWDVRAADLNRPWDDAFVSKPHLAAALEEGYGGFDDRLRVQIQALRLLGAVGGVVWATSVGDWPYVALNRAAIQRLMKAA